MELLDTLNKEQRDAVTHIDGPLLILAGAGSGKTRVITYRIAYMVQEKNISPKEILAITFTNKAAGEMRERLEGLVGYRSKYMACGTFHSIFARILRKHLDPNFAIIDSDDQEKLVKQAMKDVNAPTDKIKPSMAKSMISNAKNHMVEPNQFCMSFGRDFISQHVEKIYARYNEILKANNAMDFDDILVNTVKLFEQRHDVLEFYQEQYKYIMVDEYQDTNMPQYRAVMLLASRYRNICVVGDDDQSIYAFRGANVQLILDFEKDFPDCCVVKLEENYRSTGNILKAANSIIANNSHRTSKALRTSGGDGDKIILMNADSGIGEARYVVDTINMLVKKGKCKYSDIAILYRVNAMSRNIDKALHNSGIPFRVYGGMRFFDRKEIKDVLAYLRLINDDGDNLAFERIINVPRRGIGDTTLEKIRLIGTQEGMSLFEVARNCDMYPDLSRSASKLAEFTELILRMREMLLSDTMNFAEFVDYVENESGIIEECIEERTKKGEIVDRVENLKELLSEAADFEKAHRTEAPEETSSEEGGDAAADLFDIGSADTTDGILKLYLDNAALYTEGDNFDDNDDFVRLMTVHSAKGLEFKAVFLIGVEEGIFPGYRSIASEADLEEERRLMYVAVTRAKRYLFIVVAQQRMLYGQTQCNKPSRFVSEIDKDLLYAMGLSRAQPAASQIDASRMSANTAISETLADKYKKSSVFRANAAKKENKVGLRADQIKKGMKVVHDRFGEGVVLSVEPTGGDALVSVDFDGMRKNLLANSAGLKPLGL